MSDKSEYRIMLFLYGHPQLNSGEPAEVTLDHNAKLSVLDNSAMNRKGFVHVHTDGRILYGLKVADTYIPHNASEECVIGFKTRGKRLHLPHERHITLLPGGRVAIVAPNGEGFINVGGHNYRRVEVSRESVKSLPVR